MPPDIKILLVDDNDDLTRIISIILSAEGFVVMSCNSLPDAYSLVQSFQPDLILLDVKLGNEDGRELCFYLKDQQHNSAIKVILMSGDETTLNNQMADDLIYKPFDTAHLLEKVRSCMGRAVGI